jgi:hypothetical protein
MAMAILTSEEHRFTLTGCGPPAQTHGTATLNCHAWQLPWLCAASVSVQTVTHCRILAGEQAHLLIELSHAQLLQLRHCRHLHSAAQRSTTHAGKVSSVWPLGHAQLSSAGSTWSFRAADSCRLWFNEWLCVHAVDAHVAAARSRMTMYFPVSHKAPKPTEANLLHQLQPPPVVLYYVWCTPRPRMCFLIDRPTPCYQSPVAPDPATT